MTTPIVTAQPAMKNKTWLVTAASVVGFIIAGLTWIAPVLPEKFSAIALLVLGILAPIGTFLAKYKEPDEIIVKKAEVEAAGAVVADPVTPHIQPPLPPPPSGPLKGKDYYNPYEQQ